MPTVNNAGEYKERTAETFMVLVCRADGQGDIASQLTLHGLAITLGVSAEVVESMPTWWDVAKMINAILDERESRRAK